MQQLRRTLESLAERAKAARSAGGSSVRVSDDRNIVTAVNTPETGDSTSATSVQHVRTVQDSSGTSKDAYVEKKSVTEEA